MRSLSFKKAIIFIVLLVILASCAYNNSGNVSQVDDEVVEKSENNNEKIKENIKENETIDNVDKVLKVNRNTSVDNTKQPKTNEDFIENTDNKNINENANDEFSQYDNKLLGWWYRPQKDNKPSTIDKPIENLLNKYDGIFIHHTDEKVLYLTFDEGYENGYTPKILDTLKGNDVKAAFFITAPYLKNNTELVKRMVDEGHIVGNHSVTHPSLPKVKDFKKIEEEILGVERQFYEMFGKNMHYFRPPRGEYSERTLAITKSLGYKSVFWSFAYRDWERDKQKGAEHAYNTVMKGMHNGALMLLHAVSKDNADALDKIIKDAKKQGYEFKTLDEIK